MISSNFLGWMWVTNVVLWSLSCCQDFTMAKLCCALFAGLLAMKNFQEAE